MSTATRPPPRALTTNRALLPAVHPGISAEYLAELPHYTAVQWTFGAGSVLWKVWPACLLHILFALAIVCVNHFTPVHVSIPNILLTVLGVVIGFVISYRASSGYDRYWMGRSAWAEIIKTSRTMTRLIHFHVPSRLTPKTAEEIQTGEVRRTRDEKVKAMKEKKMAMDLVEAFAFATKHHLRGELGIYYQDLYDLVKPLHDPDTIESDSSSSDDESDTSSIGSASIPPPPKRAASASSSALEPPIIKVPHKRHLHHKKSSVVHQSGEREPLLPGQLPRPKTVIMDNKPRSPQLDLMPFGSIFSKVVHVFRSPPPQTVAPSDVHGIHKSKRRWGGVVFPKIGVPKGAPRTNGTGEIVPLEILRCLSEWISVLEDRNTVPGTSLGSLLACIAAYEAALSQLEAIITTPLPFGYAVHIRHTVWCYLFFLPFQIVEQYEWMTLVAVGITAFIYLGFLAAGEEIEQPFGYDENDLDLDLFCREVVADEVEVLKKLPGLNVYQYRRQPSPPQEQESKR
ncbi:UPF0187-domain-containing protein [Flagelloscypha sp. PMI_526]|nr:UPF0187-domain-containing protein [Flagelloscypha sp. PMI_526]